MKIKPYQLAMVCGIVWCTSVSAAEVFRSEIKMDGSILETPCAIAMDSYDQTIVLDMLPISTLKQWSEGPRQPFSIKLIDCRLTSLTGTGWSSFTMTFDGPSEPYGFYVFGTARGVVLRVDDAKGNIIIPGQPLFAESLQQGERKLEYGLRLVSNHTAYTPGDFQSILRFKLDYN